MLICWGVVAWCLLLKIVGGCRGVCHVLHEVHSLCVVLNYILSLRALQWRLFSVFSVTLGRRVERRRLQSEHVVVWPLVSKVYLVRESDSFVLDRLRFGWLYLAKVE